MASAKTTFSLFALLVVLGGIGVGGAYFYQAFQAHAVEKDLKAAETALAEKRPKDAEQLLVARLDRADASTPWLPQAMALRFRALDALNDSSTAAALAQKVLNADHPLARPGDEAWSRAHLILATVALSNNLADQAQQHLQAVLGQPPRGDNDPVMDEAQLGQARIELASGKIEAGRDRLAQLQQRLANDSPVKARVEKVLGDVNVRMLFDLQPYGRDQIHVLAKGDSLDRLSKQYGISADLLMGINHIPDARRLRIGRRIKIPDLKLSLVVDKSNNTLMVYNQGKFFKRYTVRTGTDDYKTPVGDYEIMNKAKDPAWFNAKENRKIPPGDPANELGSRWMGFQGTSLGIHEARDPNSLGKYSSNGCVGMARQDVQELFDMVAVGTPLKIQGQMNPALMDSSANAALAGLGSAQSSAAGGAASPAPKVNPLQTPPPAQPEAVLPQTDAGAQADALPQQAEEATPTPRAAKGRRRARAAAGAVARPAAAMPEPSQGFGQ